MVIAKEEDRSMNPLTKMLIALIAIVTMFLANLLIMFARSKLKGIWKWVVSIIAYVLLALSFIFIVLVIFTFSY
jgi:ABC-type dipeptide/oligopeptide/nickel transport system permease component